jgi:hypothetical protein
VYQDYTKKAFWLGAVFHICNPSYLGDGDQEDHGLRPAQGKASRGPISTNGWMQWSIPVIPAMWRKTNRGITVQTYQARHDLKKKKKKTCKKGLGDDSSGRAPG